MYVTMLKFLKLPRQPTALLERPPQVIAKQGPVLQRRRHKRDSVSINHHLSGIVVMHSGVHWVLVA